MPGIRRIYASGGMFMIDITGFFDAATRSSSSRTAGARYCGSCMASTTRSKPAGSVSAGVAAESEPASLPE